VTVTHRARIAVVALALLLPGVAACSTNFGAETDRVYQPARGTDSRSGDVEILNAVIVAPSKGQGTVSAMLANDATTDDTLTGVMLGDKQATISGGQTASQIKGGGTLNLAQSGAVTVKDPSIVPGDFVTLTFQFQNADSATLQVPVVPNTGDYASTGASPSASSSPSNG
jgi:hypothetical protein